MTEIKHTPTPWLWDESEKAMYGAIDWHRREAERDEDIYEFWPVAIIETDGGQYGPKPADAAFIVRAVNAHEALMEALEGIATQDKFTGATPENLPLWQAYAILNSLRLKAQAALKLAKGDL